LAADRRIALVVEPSRRDDQLPAWAAAWHENGRAVKRRIAPAWLAPTGSRDAKPAGKTYGKSGAWTQRRGRPRGSAIDQRSVALHRGVAWSVTGGCAAASAASGPRSSMRQPAV
jgi:hypothetical protein